MGNAADDRLNEQALKKKLGGAFSGERLRTLDDQADELSITDNMNREDALKIVSGQSRLPYGTPRPR